MSLSTDPRSVTPLAPDPARFRIWPLWMCAAGLLGVIGTLLSDQRAGESGETTDYTVTVADMADLDHLPFRIGGFAGYLCVAALLVLAAVWNRRVTQRYPWSLGAPVVTYGLVAAAGALALAYGWKGALGDYLPGAAEHGAYDDTGLYTYYVMNDFSPYVGWVPVAVAMAGIAILGLRERLVSRPLGVFAAAVCLLCFGAVAVTGVPGLPFVSMLGLLVVGMWLAVGNSAIVQEVEA